ncbi:MAG: hypothetical protein QJR13_03820 [Bacillota bacterium]|nr:hypothetical protein [Bacillota bacterium]
MREKTWLRWLVPCVLAVMAVTAGPALAAAGSLAEGLAFLAEGRKCLYNTPFAQAKEKLVQAREIFLALGNSGPQGERHLAYYHAAEASLELGTWYESQGEQKENLAQAAREFAAAEEAARRSLQLKKDFAGAYRVLAESYMRQMPYKGALYTMSKGGEAKKLLDTALRLDKQDPANYLSTGLWYQGAPAMVGGSLTRALAHFRKAAELANDDFQRFYALVWTGLTLNRLQEYAAAQEAFTQALAIYPESAWAKSGLAEAEAGGKK